MTQTALPSAPAANGAPGNVLRIGLNTSQPDAYSIVGILQNLANQFGRTPDVREFTVNDVLCSEVNNNQTAYAQIITDFVKNHLTYIADPVGSEYVISPVNLIAQIKQGASPAGDCDDHCLLLASMLQSVGIPCRIVGVKLNGSQLFNHVIVSAYLNGDWNDIDPCAKEVPQPIYTEKLIAG